MAFWEAEWVTGIEKTRDCTTRVCLCFDCGPLRCICSLIRWEQLHCDWEPAAWGIMRGSIRAHRASKGKSADPLGWKIILMMGNLFCMPVLVKTLSPVHSLPLSQLDALIAWKRFRFGILSFGLFVADVFWQHEMMWFEDISSQNSVGWRSTFLCCVELG